MSVGSSANVPTLLSDEPCRSTPAPEREKRNAREWRYQERSCEDLTFDQRQRLRRNDSFQSLKRVTCGHGSNSSLSLSFLLYVEWNHHPFRSVFCALRQCRRGNLALITTRPVLDCLYLCPTSAAQRSGEKASCSHEKQMIKKHQRSNTSQWSHQYDTCTRLPSQPSPHRCSPPLMVRATKKMPRRAKTDHPRTSVATRQICNVRKLAVGCHKLNWRLRLALAHPVLVRDLSRLLPMRPSGFSNGLPRGPTLLGLSFGICLAWARVTAIHSFLSCFFQSPQHFGLLVFSRCLAISLLGASSCVVNTWLPTLVLRLLGKMAWLKACLAEGVPALVNYRCLQPLVNNIRGDDKGAQNTFLMCSQSELSRSFTNNSSWEICHFLGPHLSPNTRSYCRIIVDCNQQPEPRPPFGADFSPANLVRSSQLDCPHLSVGLPEVLAR